MLPTRRLSIRLSLSSAIVRVCMLGERRGAPGRGDPGEKPETKGDNGTRNSGTASCLASSALDILFRRCVCMVSIGQQCFCRFGLSVTRGFEENISGFINRITILHIWYWGWLILCKGWVQLCRFFVVFKWSWLIVIVCEINWYPLAMLNVAWR